MTVGLSSVELAKSIAAHRSVSFVEDGMCLGLGTGSTAAWMVRCLAARVRDEGLKITCVATSSRTATLARDLGLTVRELDAVPRLDLTIDGADEIDPALNLIKGGGAALLREKIVATASNRMIVIADPDKEVATLGAFPLPVEVVPFGWQTTKGLIEQTLTNLKVQTPSVTLRLQGDMPLQTDEGHYILDLHLNRIDSPQQLGLALNQIPGVVENGLFVDTCDMAIIGHADGRVVLRDRGQGESRQEMVDMEFLNRILTTSG